MRRIVSNKSGQFVIIAVLLIAIMIISMGALMHGAVTYYKHEPWEEYTTLIGDIELNSGRLLELSLVNYTNSDSPNAQILKDNLDQWQKDIGNIYPNTGIDLSYDLAQEMRSVNGRDLSYSLGIHTNSWYQPRAASSAQCDLTIGINSIGLTGHKLTTTAILSLNILNYTSINATTSEAFVLVEKENNLPVVSLKKDNFKVENAPIHFVSSAYEESIESMVYSIVYEGTNAPRISVWDQRGIRVIAEAN
jgi:hypothetical protein